MLKTRFVSAAAIELADGVEAVFVPDGAEWNEMQAHMCIAPSAFAGERIITAPDSQQRGPMATVFADIFGEVPQAVIVMATPKIAEALRALRAREASK